MKYLSCILMAALMSLVVPAQQARAQDSVSVDFFYDALAPYGDWVYIEGYGYSWRPEATVVNADWSPYSDGYWAYTDAGWTWISNEEFGWATYHYGRWIRAYGDWVWVPGTEWAPAWVSWRSNDDYVGWAPLPPEATWSGDVGFSSSIDTYYDIGPSYYNFIPYNRFGSPSMRPFIVERSRNVSLFGLSINVTNTHRYEGGHVGNIFVGGPDIRRLERLSGGPVRRFDLRRDDGDFRREWLDRGRDGRPGSNSAFSRIRDNQLLVAAPRFQRGNEASRPSRVSDRFSKEGVDRGWRGLGDSKQAEQLREKQRAEFAKLNPKDRPDRKPQIVTGMTPPPATGPNAPKRIIDGPPGANGRPNGGDSSRGPGRDGRDDPARDSRPGMRPDGTRADGTRPDGMRPDGTRPDVARPDGSRPDGTRPDGTRGDRDGRPGGEMVRPGVPVLPRDRDREQRTGIPGQRDEEGRPVRPGMPATPNSQTDRPDRGTRPDMRPDRPGIPDNTPPTVKPEERAPVRPQQPADRPGLPQIRPEVSPQRRGEEGEGENGRSRRGGGPPADAGNGERSRPSMPQAKPEQEQPPQRPDMRRELQERVQRELRPQQQPQVQERPQSRPQVQERPQVQQRPQPQSRPQVQERPQPQAQERPQASQRQPQQQPSPAARPQPTAQPNPGSQGQGRSPGGGGGKGGQGDDDKRGRGR